MIKRMVKEYLFIKTGLDIKANGKMISKMELEFKFGLMARGTQANISKVKSMEKVF